MKHVFFKFGTAHMPRAHLAVSFAFYLLLIQENDRTTQAELRGSMFVCIFFFLNFVFSLMFIIILHVLNKFYIVLFCILVFDGDERLLLLICLSLVYYYQVTREPCFWILIGQRLNYKWYGNFVVINFMQKFNK